MIMSNLSTGGEARRTPADIRPGQNYSQRAGRGGRADQRAVLSGERDEREEGGKEGSEREVFCCSASSSPVCCQCCVTVRV